MDQSNAKRSPREDGRTCCLCGGDDFRLLHQWEADHPRNSATIPLSVWECRCGLAILHPIPTPDVLPQAGEWWTNQRKFIQRRRWWKQLRNPIKDRLFGTAKERLVRQTHSVVRGGKLLDIGCGPGKILKIAQRWYECHGVEPSERAVGACKEMGFHVTHGMFEDVELPGAHYDVALMDAVLEHVFEPVEILKKVNRVLKPGGVLVVKVPKLWGPAHRMHGREWNGYRVGYHTFLYTGKTLGAIMNAAGFQVLKKPKRDRPLDDLLALWGRKVREVETAADANADNQAAA